MAIAAIGASIYPIKDATRSGMAANSLLGRGHRVFCDVQIKAHVSKCIRVWREIQKQLGERSSQDARQTL